MTKPTAEKMEKTEKMDEKVTRGPMGGMDLVMDVMRKVRAQIERLPSAVEAGIVLDFATRSLSSFAYTPSSKGSNGRQPEPFEDLPE